MKSQRRWPPPYAAVSLVNLSSFRRKPKSRVLAILFLFALIPALSAQDFSALDAAAGQALFERNWLAAPASTAASDGLGPYYNARSCAACHPGGAASEPALNTLNLVVDDARYGALLQLRAVSGLRPEVRAELTQVPVATPMLDAATPVQLSRPVLQLSALQYGGDAEALAAATSLRRAPSLHGLALLERVSLAELQTLADPDDRDGDGISGRLAADGGRFGWKASAPTLRAQVARALSFDLGLGNPLLPSAAGDCTSAQPACAEAARALTGHEPEVPATVLDLLVSYLESLPPPRWQAASGEGGELFTELGCAACHRPQLSAAGQPLYPYSDLLLHDLGPGLANGLEAEWRTAPLWGLGQTQRFLHDGRAASLEEAVLWHDGEAAASLAAYRKLDPASRAVLQAWLLGL